ncbi:MAG: hypothetical protein N4J56_007115 [Chroococcidiopsis sp. SAG 2025]|nr:hypothetical protein [Chroococcidiopsis sp. SAG 2025]
MYMPELLIPFGVEHISPVGDIPLMNTEIEPEMPSGVEHRIYSKELPKYIKSNLEQLP